MKTIRQLLSKNKDLIAIFALSSFLSLPHLVDICSGYLNYLSFDSQEFLLWNYSAINGYMPYKDLFYPYGLISYYKNYNLILSFIYYSFSPIFLTILFFLFKKVFKDKYYLYFSFATFYVFVLKIIGFDTFSRYGLFVVSSLVFAEILYLNKNLKLKLFTVGIFLGLINFLIPDLGIYTVLTFLLLFLVHELIKSKKISFFSLKNIFKSLSKIKLVLFGLLIGISPLIIFSFYHKNLLLLVNYYSQVRNIALVAKTPFFSFVNSPSNIFTLSILFASIFIVLYRLSYLKRKVRLSAFFQIALIIDILILEQKSIVRSIDLQITFVSLILLMIIVYEFIHALFINILNKKIFYTFFILLTVVLFSLSVPGRELSIKIIATSAKLSITNKCFDSNLKKFLSQNLSYAKVIELLKKRRDFNNKIFSFPTGDSAFYILLGQKPPYYNAIFEGSSVKKQTETIKYIEDNYIKFITLNTDMSFLQDGVPDYIRQNLLFRYILNNYYPLTSIDNHLILEHQKNNDFFGYKVLDQQREYKNYLLNIDLKNIPLSEGTYKSKSIYLPENKILIKSGDYKKINIFLENSKIDSHNKVFIIKFTKPLARGDRSYMKIQTQDNKSTVVSFISCLSTKPCIVNLSSIPLFYKDRILKKIEINKSFKGELILMDFKTLEKIW